MIKAALVIESWKRDIFEKHLRDAKIKFDIVDGPVADAVTLRAAILSVEEFKQVVESANNAAHVAHPERASGTDRLRQTTVDEILATVIADIRSPIVDAADAGDIFARLHFFISNFYDTRESLMVVDEFIKIAIFAVDRTCKAHGTFDRIGEWRDCALAVYDKLTAEHIGVLLKVVGQDGSTQASAN